MDDKVIICISREYGSGGYEVGKRLSEEYNIPLYDKELIEKASKESGIVKDLFEAMDQEKSTKSFLYSVVMNGFQNSKKISTSGTVSMIDRLFVAQSEAIQKAAKENSCVIIGRCANYILKDYKECFRVFIYAEEYDKIENICKRENIKEQKAKDIMKKIDKNRASYYNYYTNQKWGTKADNDICLNSTSLGIDGCIDIIKKSIELKKQTIKNRGY